MTYYILDHYYAVDHEYSSRITSSDRERHDVEEILTAVQFWWEEHVDECRDPDLDGVLGVLQEHFGFCPVAKDAHIERIRRILDIVEESSSESFLINGDSYEYIDLYSTREHYCGPGSPERLYGKWLTDDGLCRAVEACPALE